jgi:hypothetical protein
MTRWKKYFDTGSLAVMALTLVLFVLALFLKGFKHDLLLEAGVFLVSVKLILQAYKNAVTAEEIRADLHGIREALQSLGNKERS